MRTGNFSSMYLAFALLVVVVAGISAGAGKEGRRLPLTLKPCRLPALPNEELRCGTYEVYEDRVTKRGRKVGLNVVVLPALGAHPLPDPLFFLAGGPGSAATQMASFANEAVRTVRRDRDIVLVDQRGTGSSNRPVRFPFSFTKLTPATLRRFRTSS